MRKALHPFFPKKASGFFELLFVFAMLPLFNVPLQQLQELRRQAHAATPAIGGGDWPAYLHDPQRSAANLAETQLSPGNAGNLKKLWTFKTGGIIAASPTVVGSTVYVGSWDGYEYALDAATGQQKWRAFLGQSYQPACDQQHPGVTSAATVANGVVYVAGGDANFYALNAATGGFLWKVFIGDPALGYYNYSSPLLYNGNIYYGTASRCDNPLVQGQLLQISTSTHALVRTFHVVPDGQTGGAIWTSPSVDPATNTVFVATGNGGSGGYSISVIALDATTLAVKSSWQVPTSQQVTDSDFSTTPTVFTTSSTGTMVAANDKNGSVYAFRAGNLGAGPLWQNTIARGGECPECGQGSISSDAFANNLLYVAGGNTTINGTSYQGAVRAFDPATGAHRWEHGAAGPVFAALAYANSLLVDGAGSILEVLNAANGTLLFHFQTGGALYSAPSVANGKIFVGSTDTNVYAFGV